MSPEERELLNRSVSLAEENNKILHAMKRSQHITSIGSFIYWTFIIGTALGAVYFLQPYFNQIKVIYENASILLKNLSSH